MNCEIVLIAGKTFVLTESREQRLVLKPADFDVLLALNSNNRKLNRKWVDELYRRLNVGLWRYNGEPIVISATGKLLNGQHRLHAFRRYGKPVEVVIVTGIPDEAWSTFDGGQRRTFVQELTKNGIPHANGVSSLTRAIWLYANRHFVGDQSIRVSMDELEDFRKKIDAIGGIVSHVSSTRSLKKLGSSVAVGFLLFAGQNVLTKEHFDHMLGVLSGNIAADKTDVFFTLRERLLLNKSAKAKLQSREVIAICIKTLNCYMLGKVPKFIKWQSGANEPFPDVLGLTPESLKEMLS